MNLWQSLIEIPYRVSRYKITAKQWLWLLIGLAGVLVAGCQPAPTSLPPVPTLTVESEMLPRVQRPDTPAWDTVQSWAYQLTGYADNHLDEIAASGYDLVVIDLARDGSTNYFTFEEIRNLQATGKFVLAYFEIGVIENYRPEWATLPKDLKLGPVADWPGEQHVRYWDPRWWPVVQGRIDQALAAGFDGAYLDMVVTYEQISTRATGLSIKERAQAMVDLIARVSVYAKDRDPAFKIVPQNAPELHARPGYLDAIDGLGIEELYFRATDKPCTARWCAENRKAALAIKAAGKLVLAVDYAMQPDNVRAAYTQARADGFVPYVATVELDRLSGQP